MNKRMIVDGSYPIEMVGRVIQPAPAVSKGTFWSSAERYASDDVQEHITIAMKRNVPVNSVRFKMSDKPVMVSLLYSESATEDDWIPWELASGGLATLRVGRWGGNNLGGDFMQVDFSLAVRVVRRIRITFDRIDIPFDVFRFSETKPNFKKRFPYSIEVSDLVIEHGVMDSEDYLPHTHEDMFGNLVETSLVAHSSDSVLDADPNTFWSSKPNVSPSAVEWLAFDMRQLQSESFDTWDIDDIYIFNLEGYEDWAVDDLFIWVGGHGLGAGLTSRGLIRFDLLSMLPGYHVESATLSLFHTVGAYSTQNASLYPLPNSWDVRLNRMVREWNDSTSSFIKSDVGAPWGDAGASGVSDIVTEPSSVVTVTGETFGRVEFDVTSDVSMFVSGESPNYGWRVSAPEIEHLEGCKVGSRFMSSSSIDDSPVLTVVYAINENAAGGQMFDAIDIDPIVGGCRMNIYVSDDTDNTSFADKVWTPVPGSYRLARERIVLPPQRAKFVKVEFTNLAPIPYRLESSDIEREMIVHPRRIAVPSSSNSESLDRIGTLLHSPDVRSYSEYEAIGVVDIGDAEAAAILRRESILDKGLPDDYPNLWGVDVFSEDLGAMVESDISSVLDGDMRTEYYMDELIPRRAVASRSEADIAKFAEKSVHEYDRRVMRFENDVAYVVSVRDVYFSFLGSNVMFEPGGFWAENFSFPMYESESSWVNDGRRLIKGSSSVARYVSEKFVSLQPFQVFEFKTNERTPVEKFGDVSFVNGIDEWNVFKHVAESASISWEQQSFSGNVLRVERDGEGSYGGIISDLIGVQMGGYCIFSCSVFVPDAIEGNWFVEAFDVSEGTVVKRRFFPEKDKWSRVSISFLTQPSGMWWNEDYQYRKRVTISATSRNIGSGSSVNIREDTSLLVDDAKLLQSRDDWRVVYFNGTAVYEIDRDYTGVTDDVGSVDDGTDETWVRVQRDIRVGESDDGYFLYYGFGDETSQPMSDLGNIFYGLSPNVLGDETYDGGIDVSREGAKCRGVSYSAESVFPVDSGAISLFYTPTGGWIDSVSSVVDEPLKLDDVTYGAIKQFPYNLAYSFVVGDPVVRSMPGGGGALYVDGDDYDWDSSDGSIKRRAGGSISDGDTVYVSYYYLDGMRDGNEIAVRTLLDSTYPTGERITLELQQKHLMFRIVERPLQVKTDSRSEHYPDVDALSGASVFRSTSYAEVDWGDGDEHFIVVNWTAPSSPADRRKEISIFVDGVDVTSSTQMVYDEVTYDSGRY